MDSTKRYIVKAPTGAGTYAAEFGWRVVDTRPLNPDCATVASGNQSQATRMACDLNRRED